MYRKVLPLILAGVPITVYAVVLALVALLMRASGKSVVSAMARESNALIYICIAMLFFAFVIWENPQLLRLSCLMLLTLILMIAIDRFRFTSCFKFCADFAFWFHIVAIGLSIALDKPLLLGGNEVPERYGGFFGYDFVSFFICSYLVMQLHQDARQVQLMTYVKLVLGAMAIIQSGRFGYMNLSILGAYFLLSSFSIKKIIFSFALGALSLFWFSEKIAFTYLSFQFFFKEALGAEVSYDLLTSPDGYYGQSFRTFIAEANSLSAVTLTPSASGSFEVVDSGIVNTLGAAGWLLGSLAIINYFRFVNFSTLHTGSLSLILIVTDLKIRCFYSPFPMLWFFIMLKIMTLNSSQASSQVGYPR